MIPTHAINIPRSHVSIQTDKSERDVRERWFSALLLANTGKDEQFDFMGRQESQDHLFVEDGNRNNE